MPRSTREKSKTGTCHVGLGRNQKPVPVIFGTGNCKLLFPFGQRPLVRLNVQCLLPLTLFLCTLI